MRGVGGRGVRYGKLTPGAQLRAQLTVSLPHWARVLVLTSLAAGGVLIPATVEVFNQDRERISAIIAAQHVGRTSSSTSATVPGGSLGLSSADTGAQESNTSPLVPPGTTKPGIPQTASGETESSQAESSQSESSQSESAKSDNTRPENTQPENTQPETQAALELRTRSRASAIDDLSRTLLVEKDLPDAAVARREPVLLPAKHKAPLSALTQDLDDTRKESFTRVRWVDAAGVEHYDNIQPEIAPLGTRMSVWVENGEVVRGPIHKTLELTLIAAWILTLLLSLRPVSRHTGRRAEQARARLRYHGTALAQERVDAQARAHRLERLTALKELRSQHSAPAPVGDPERTRVASALWELTRDERRRAVRARLSRSGERGHATPLRDGAESAEIRLETWERFWDWNGEADLLVELTQAWGVSVLPGHAPLEPPQTESDQREHERGVLSRTLRRLGTRAAEWVLRRTSASASESFPQPQREHRNA